MKNVRFKSEWPNNTAMTAFKSSVSVDIVPVSFCFTTSLLGLVHRYLDFTYLFLKQNFSAVDMPFFGIKYVALYQALVGVAYTTPEALLVG